MSGNNAIMKHGEHFLVTWVAKTHVYTTSVTPPQVSPNTQKSG